MSRTPLYRRAQCLASTSALALALAFAPVGLPGLGSANMTAAAQADVCCFVGDTPVLLANGRSCPIARIRPGALVMGMDGHANRVLKVESPRLGRRKLYAFDGGRPFVTAEHPFLTKQGWKSIDPAAAGRERVTLEISVLCPGDRVARGRVWMGFPEVEGNLVYAAQPKVELEFQQIKSIEAVDADPELTVYNLMLDGDHTYFADRYLVHNKDAGESGGGPGQSGAGGSVSDNAGADNAGNASSGNGNSESGASESESTGDSGAGGGGSTGGTSGVGGNVGVDAGGAGSAVDGATGGVSTGAAGTGAAGGSATSGAPAKDEAADLPAEEDVVPASTTLPAAAEGVEPPPQDSDAASTGAAAVDEPSTILNAPPPAPAQRAPAAPAGSTNSRYGLFGGSESDPSALEQVGPDLTPEEERDLIDRGWE